MTLYKMLRKMSSKAAGQLNYSLRRQNVSSKKNERKAKVVPQNLTQDYQAFVDVKYSSHESDVVAFVSLKALKSQDSNDEQGEKHSEQRTKSLWAESLTF